MIRRRSNLMWLPVVVGVLGSAATAVTTMSLWSVDESKAQHRFEQIADQATEEIQLRMRSYITLLAGSAGLFSGSEEVTPEEFARYTARIRLSEDYPGVQGIGFLKFLQGEAAASKQLAVMRERHGTSFGFSPSATESAARCVVEFIEPPDRRNQATFGWDMWSDPVRRAALERARDTGLPASTSVVTLKQELDDDNQSGFLIFVPVYTQGNVPASPEDRRLAIAGFTYCPFRTTDLFTRVVPSLADGSIDLEIRHQHPDGSILLYQSQPGRAGAEGVRTRDSRIEVAGTIWSIKVSAGSAFREAQSTSRPSILGALGTLFTASLVGLTFVQARSRQKEDLAAQRTAVSEGRYRLLATATASIVWTSDPQGRFITTQDSWQAYTGQAWETYRDRGWLEAIHAADRERVESLLNAAVESKSAFEAQGRIWSQATRGYRWSVMRGVPMLRASGAIYEWVGLVSDVQDRRSLEESLLQSRKLESLGRLAGGIAHDFNNLLTAIIGSADLVAMEPNQTETSRTYLNTIREAAKRSAVLTHHLLSFARKQVIEPRNVEINALVKALVPILERVLGEDVKLVTALPADTGLTRIDPGQFEQVLVNLATNARDAMPQGGILSIQTSNAELTEEYARTHEGVVPGRYIMLLVSDNGVGMDSALQQHIFEPFFTTKEAGKGTGLGLATCYGIVRQAGGFIWVYSEPGKGSLFRIFLPRADGVADQTSQKHEESPAFGTETILLVEDELMVRQIAAAALRGFGYSVLPAGSGEEALAIANAFAGQIHMVVTDVVLPQMSGKELGERLQAIRPGLFVLHCSGYTDSVISRRGVLDDGIAFLQKPYTPRQLARRVRSILDGTPYHSAK